MTIDQQGVEPSLSVPLHKQIYEKIRLRILAGDLRPGDLLPAESELRNTFKVSRFTLRQGLDALVREGLLTRYRGKGTFVTRPRVLEQPLSGFYSFAQVMAGRGLSQHSKVLEFEPLAASQEVARQLGIDPGEKIVRIVRLRFADGDPLVLETSHLPHRFGRFLSPADLSTGSIYDLLEAKVGVSVTGAREIIRPVVLRASECDLLMVDQGATAFDVERVAFAGEMDVEWRVSLIRGDRYAYVAELPRVS